MKMLNTETLKNVCKDDFLHERDFELSKGTIYKHKGSEHDILKIFFGSYQINVLLYKKKKTRGNHAPFMSMKMGKQL